MNSVQKNNPLFFTGIVLFAAFFGLHSCNSSPNKVENAPNNNSPESFDDFYLRFHQDSLFQIKRVVFPLKGFQSDNTTDESADFETPNPDIEHWVMMRLPDLDPDMLMETKKTDTMVTERIYIDGAGFETGSTFKLINGLWYLDYFYTRM